VICHPCEVAGYLNQEANRLAMLESVEAAESVRVLCRNWHAGCRDRTTCPCQHVVGDVLNHQRIRDDETASSADVPSADGPQRSVYSIPG
jgi:hypothetical protein